MKNILTETPCLKEDEIKRYLAEESTKDELRRVENHLLDCPFCNDAIEGLQGYYSFETDGELEELKATIFREDRTEEKAKVVTMQRRGRLFTLNRVAAAVLLLLLPAATWLYLSNNSPTNGNEFGNSSTLRSGGGVGEEASDLLKVISLYENEQFEAALAASQNMLEENKEDVKTTYYAGLAALKSEEYKLAADYFMTVRMNSDFYYEEATWLEVQAHLGAKDTASAKLLLDGITEKPDSGYYEDALALRKTLE
ncbi:MAG: tol-pal system YbgF family protein [Saprospiraceae bacterium]